MKRLILLLALTTLALATVCTLQWRKLGARADQIRTLSADLEERTQRIAELEAGQQRAEEQRRELLQTAETLADQVRAQQQAAARLRPTTNASPVPAVASTDATKPDPGGLGGFLGKMISDPDTKKFIREQQRMMMDQLYRPLVKQMGLTPEQAAGFKDLLADNMIKSTEKAGSLLSGMSGTNRAALAGALAADQQSLDEQLKAYLGEERFRFYKDYQETVGERTQLNLFRQQNDAGEYPLNDLQVEQLLAFMKDEKRNVAAALGQDASGASRDQAALDAMFSDEQAEKFTAAQESANQRVFERARSVLSPDQLQALGAFQTNQLRMMRAGMSMARKLMAPPSPTPTSPP